jgi:hypothetical protein
MTEFRNYVFTIMVKMAAHDVLCGHVSSIARAHCPRIMPPLPLPQADIASGTEI